jgi:hypothetical protein
MHAGLIGILVYAVVIGLCCRVIDEFARQRDTIVKGGHRLRYGQGHVRSRADCARHCFHLGNIGENK